ncbi:MAG TPA: MBL fold metallo-hydrolase [Acidimicrobiales bacterium]|nr:MBL fold metallo-hydrolase [Acidimicrobiales bacterium]
MIPYERGLHVVGPGVFAYLQPDGGWGWSNAGLVLGRNEALLVDTLFDLRLTSEMLLAMHGQLAGRPISTVVNTHANGDHCFGNELIPAAEVIASRAATAEMPEAPPGLLGQLVSADLDEPLAGFVKHAFGPFRFDEITLRSPTRTFDDRLDVDVGGRRVELIEVGPAHTLGDVIVHVPDAGTVFTGDILFVGVTPVMWAGPIANWIAACDRIISLGAGTVVPGHGPVTDADGVSGVRAYLEWARDEATRRFEAGMSAADAARDIDLGPFAGWVDPERIVVTVDSIYRELDPTRERSSVLELVEAMASYR